MITLKNFSLETDPKIACTCGDVDCDKRAIRDSVLVKIQMIRDEVNRPIHITSGGRCPFHKDEKDKIAPGDHQNGVGVDLLVRNGIERMELVSLGLKHGATAIGVGSNFVHLGWRKSKYQVMWVY